ncbi:MAG: sugar transferase, partial [Rhodothermaceae bacterium]|nr:sugar transferase [Rhodothermaceae bacterium]
SLDEIPQLLNVLSGSMSLVGPRPPIPYEVNAYKSWHMQRLSVKPGITGLWQVSGRSTTTFDQMVNLDLEYIEKRSLPLDLKILFDTIPAALDLKTAA